MNTLHHLLSQAASLGMVFSLIYLVMEYTIGLIPALRDWMVLGDIPGRRVLFGLSALLLVMCFVTFP